MKNIHIILTTIGIVILILLFLIVANYYLIHSRDNDLSPQPPFEFNAVDHEINNLSDLYVGFEFDNSTFTVNMDITNDSIYIHGIQPEYGPAIQLIVDNETIEFESIAHGSKFPNYSYVRWKIRDLQYGETVTISLSGKGRVIASDT